MENCIFINYELKNKFAYLTFNSLLAILPSIESIIDGNNNKLVIMAIKRVNDNKIPKAAVLPKSDKAKIKNPANKMMLV